MEWEGVEKNRSGKCNSIPGREREGNSIKRKKILTVLEEDEADVVYKKQGLCSDRGLMSGGSRTLTPD